MNTLWAFGDSFTKGLGITNDGYQYETYRGHHKKIWPYLLSKHLDTNTEIVAFNGISNDMIWDNIIDKWDDILPGDYVIIGLTKLPRWQVYQPGHKQAGLFNKTPVRDTQNLLNGKLVLTNIRENMEDAFANTMTNFLFLAERFKDKGCKSYIWDSSLWQKFDTIKNETTGKEVFHNDHHWGIKGNVEMFRYLKKEMKL